MHRGLITTSWLAWSLPLSGCDPVVGSLYAREPTMDANGPEAPGHGSDARPLEPAEAGAQRDRGVRLGSARIGYYYAALASRASGSAQRLSAPSCAALLTVPREFADAVCIQGVGKLRDGGVLAYASSCSCGFECSTGGLACYELVDASSAPWGRGSSGRRLVPLRSVAVARDGILANRKLYAPALDGLFIAASESTGAFLHDGCLETDDSGSFDPPLALRLFTGDPTQYDALRTELGSDLELFVDAPHCQERTP